MSREDLRARLNRYAEWTDKIDKMDPKHEVAIKEWIQPLNYVLGAANSLLSQVEKMEEDIKVKYVSLHNQILELKKDRQREATLACRRGDLILKYKQVLKHVRKQWFHSKMLRAELRSLDEMERRNTK